MTRITTPAEYMQANGWDYEQIEATARLGVSDVDCDALQETDVKCTELVESCKARVAEYEAETLGGRYSEADLDREAAHVYDPIGDDA